LLFEIVVVLKYGVAGDLFVGRPFSVSCGRRSQLGQISPAGVITVEISGNKLPISANKSEIKRE
jgi:hypothetical protein